MLLIVVSPVAIASHVIEEAVKSVDWLHGFDLWTILRLELLSFPHAWMRGHGIPLEKRVSLPISSKLIHELTEITRDLLTTSNEDGNVILGAQVSFEFGKLRCDVICEYAFPNDLFVIVAYRELIAMIIFANLFVLRSDRFVRGV